MTAKKKKQAEPELTSIDLFRADEHRAAAARWRCPRCGAQHLVRQARRCPCAGERLAA